MSLLDAAARAERGRPTLDRAPVDPDAPYPVELQRRSRVSGGMLGGMLDEGPTVLCAGTDHERLVVQRVTAPGQRGAKKGVSKIAVAIRWVHPGRLWAAILSAVIPHLFVVNLPTTGSADTPQSFKPLLDILLYPNSWANPGGGERG